MPFGIRKTRERVSRCREPLLEATLLVIGLNHRTAAVAVRERFWISETRRYEALAQLKRADGIQEIVILSTCNRTEFPIWANDASLAANSGLRFLTSEYRLKLCEWKTFTVWWRKPRCFRDLRLAHHNRIQAASHRFIRIPHIPESGPQVRSDVRVIWIYLQGTLVILNRLQKPVQPRRGPLARQDGPRRRGVGMGGVVEAEPELPPAPARSSNSSRQRRCMPRKDSAVSIIYGWLARPA